MKTIIAAGVALAVLAALFTEAHAHFTWLAANDPINEWLGRQRNSAGNFCCSVADAHLYYGAYTINPDGSVPIPLEGGELVIIDRNGHVSAPQPSAPPPSGPSSQLAGWSSMSQSSAVRPESTSAAPRPRR